MNGFSIVKETIRREFSWAHFEVQYNPQEGTKQHRIYLASPTYYKKAKAVIKHAGQRMEAERQLRVSSKYILLYTFMY